MLINYYNTYYRSIIATNPKAVIPDVARHVVILSLIGINIPINAVGYDEREREIKSGIG